MIHYYLKTGEKCLLVDEVNHGYLVRKHITGYLFGTFTNDLSDDIIFVEMIYDKPPIHLYDAEILKLKKEIEELQVAADGLKSVITQYMSNIVNKE